MTRSPSISKPAGRWLRAGGNDRVVQLRRPASPPCVGSTSSELGTVESGESLPEVHSTAPG